MKSLDEKFEDEIKVELNSEWLSYHAMLIQSCKSKYSLTNHIDAIIKGVNHEYDVLTKDYTETNIEAIKKDVRNIVSDNVVEYFLNNFEETPEYKLEAEINPEWFSYHIMMSQVYEPEYNTSEHMSYLLDRFNEEYTYMISNYPLEDYKYLIQDIYDNVSDAIINEVSEGSNYLRIKKLYVD